MNFFKTLLLLTYLVASTTTIAQKPANTFNIGKVEKQVFNNKTIKVYNDKTKDSILNVNKYIDTTKEIIILGGSISTNYLQFSELRKGKTFSPFGGGDMTPPIILPGGQGNIIFSIKMVDGKLKISSQVDDFEGNWIARVVDNKLITSRDDFHLYISDKYFELFGNYGYIPVLQIELIKEYNAIYIGGIFNTDKAYHILSKTGNTSRQFKPKLLMRPAERDSIKYSFTEAIKVVTPIHE